MPLENQGLAVGLTGVEAVTSALSGQRSNRLSYRPVPGNHSSGPQGRGSTQPRQAGVS